MPEPVICDICKSPIESQAEFLLGLTWMSKRLPLHRDCCISVTDKKAVSKFRLILNTDDVRLKADLRAKRYGSSRIALAVLAIIFVLIPIILPYVFFLSAIIAALGVILYGCFLNWIESRYVRIANESWELYESKLPERSSR